MNYKKQEIKKGINFHTIKTDKFKTNLLSVFITIPISKENVTKTALIPAILRRGSMNLKTSEEISIKLEEMYGASFDCGVEKIGDNQVLKFYLEVLNNEFLPQMEDNVLKTSIDTILEVVFNPLIENNSFSEQYVESEKDNLKQVIKGKKDNKATYALERCVEEMYKNEPYGLYKYGYIEDLEKIDAKNLLEHYKRLIEKSKIDIFVSGNITDETMNLVKENENINKLQERNIENITENKKTNNNKEQEIEESMDISQGKLVIGMDINEDTKEGKYIALVYNAILGGTPTSKLFQNVREKESLAYTASSSYAKQKNNIFIRCGIEIDNYNKALEIIKKQLEDMKNGNITEEEIQSAKTSIISTIKFIPDEQDTAITYYFGQELAKYKMKFEEYEQNVQSVTKEQVVDLAQKININTIYFLRN